MKIVVSDANIFIDLAEIGAFEYFTRLPFDIRTTDLVINELKKPGQREKISQCSKITITTFDVRELLTISQIPDTGISLTDKSVLYLARKHKAILLTGDSRLRNVAENYKLEVHGSIFILDQLKKSGIISKTEYKALLRLLKKTNPRLPLNEINSRLNL